MKKTIVLIFYILVTLSVFYSCNSQRVFDKYEKIPESEWHKDSLVVFQMPVSGSQQNHNVFIQLRNETTYKYSNLWLFVKIEQLGGQILRDTFEVVIAYPSGRWAGEGFGGLKTVETLYRQNVYFPVPGEYTISLQQGMRDEILTGIHDVGIRIEKVSGGE